MQRLIALSIGRVVNALSAVLMVRLYTELLPPEQLGKLSLLLSLIALFTLTLIAPVSSYVTRKAIEWHARGALWENLKQPLAYSVIVACFAAIVSGVSGRLGLLHASALGGPLVGLAVLGISVSNFGSQLFNYLDRPVTFVMLSCVISWSGITLSGVLCSQISATAETWVFGLTAAQLGGGFLAVLLIRRLGGVYVPEINVKRSTPSFDIIVIVKYSAPLLLATCFSWVVTDGYRYPFVRIADEHTLGLFVAGFAVGLSPMAFVERVITDAYLPVLTRDLALKGTEYWPSSWHTYASAAILPLVLFGMLACSGTALLAKVLVSPLYSAVSWLGFWGALVKSLQMMSSLYVGFSYAALDTKHLAGPYVIGALVMLLCMPLLIIFPNPLVGLASSLACGSLAAFISMSKGAKKRHGLHFPYPAFWRATALGVPVVAINMIAQAAIHRITVVAAVSFLGGDVIYIAGVCWLFHRRSIGGRQFQTPVAVDRSEQEVQL